MNIHNQKGAAFIIFAMVLLTVAASAFLITTKISSPSLKAKNQTVKTLGQAKKTLIDYYLTYTPSIAPWTIGRLPPPDRRNDGNYDGTGDCINASSSLPVNQNLLIGRLPWLSDQDAAGTMCSLPRRNLNMDVRDANGERLWYAVSGNMMRLNNVPSDPSLLSGVPPNPWITVYDEQGNLISNRVAFVVIAPGRAINSQNRTGAAPLASQYMDSYTVPGIGLVNNFDSVLDFVLAPETSSFNDQLIYVTIDELIPSLESRVLSEFRVLLKNHFTTNNRFPFAANLGDPGDSAGDMACVPNLFSGFIATLTDTGTSTCTNFLTIPIAQSYLTPWLPFIFYEVRAECSVTPACTRNTTGPTGLSIDGGVKDRDVVLIATGIEIETAQTTPLVQNRAAAIPPAHNRIDYLDDLENTTDDQDFVTPISSTNNNDQLIAF